MLGPILNVIFWLALVCAQVLIYYLIRTDNLERTPEVSVHGYVQNRFFFVNVIICLTNRQSWTLSVRSLSDQIEHWFFFALFSTGSEF